MHFYGFSFVLEKYSLYSVFVSPSGTTEREENEIETHQSDLLVGRA